MALPAPGLGAHRALLKSINLAQASMATVASSSANSNFLFGAPHSVRVSHAHKVRNVFERTLCNAPGDAFRRQVSL